MKRKLTLLLTIGLLALVGCEKNAVQSETTGTEAQSHQADANDATSEDEKDADQVAADLNDTVSATQQNDISIADEMAEIEKKSLEYENMNWDIPQQDMNVKTGEWYTLWDDELNSLWERLTANLSGSEKDEMIADQKAWVDCKEKNVAAEGILAYGGSLQPTLEASTAKDATRERAYYLAECLAKTTGESYTIPADIKSSFEGATTSLDDAFKSLQGEYTHNDMSYHIETLEGSDYMADDFAQGTKWLFWYSRGPILTEADIYAYSDGILVFYTGSVYYIIEKTYEGDDIMVSYGEELGFTDSLDY